MVFKTFLWEGWGKPYLRPSKKEFYSKNKQYIEGVAYVTKIFWHEGLIFKLKTYGVEGNLLKLLENYLTDRQQRVVLNGRMSSWQNVYAGVPQGSVLGPLLFLIYINDLPDELTSMCKMFADDTSLLSSVIDKNNSNSQLNSDLAKISKWAL